VWEVRGERGEREGAAGVLPPVWGEIKNRGNARRSATRQLVCGTSGEVRGRACQKKRRRAPTARVMKRERKGGASRRTLCMALHAEDTIAAGQQKRNTKQPNLTLPGELAQV